MQPKTKKTVRNVVIVVVAVVLILALWLKLANVAPYKNEIVRQISAATGYEVVVAGDIGIKLIPLSVKITDVHLRNPAGFSETDFAYVPECRAGLKLLPLISRNYVVKDLTLDGLVLQLERNQEGVANWDFGGEVTNRKPQIAQMILGFSFNDLKVKNGLVVYRNLSAFGGSTFNMEELELRAGPFSDPLNRLNFELTAKGQNIPMNMQGYTTETLSQILNSNWPYEVQLHFINNSFGIAR